MMTREHIIQVSTQLFLRNGVKSVTIGEITEELRTSKRTIYSHFEDKTDLMHACIQNYLESIRSNNDEIIKKSNNAIEALGYIHQQILKRGDSPNSNFHLDIRKHFPSIIDESYKKNGETAFKELLSIMKWGIMDGYFRQDIDPEITMKTVQSLIKLCQNTRKFPSVTYSKDRLTSGIMVPYLRGLCTAKGIEEVDKKQNLFLQNKG